MKQDRKFITPVSMKCTKEQYDRDLQQPLKELGYEIIGGVYDNFYLCTNTHCKHNHYSLETDEVHLDSYRHFIPTYSSALLLALAAMTEGDFPIVGEYVTPEKPHLTIWGEKGDIKKVTDTFIRNNFISINKNSAASCTNMNLWRKATKEELIQHFTKENTFVLPDKWHVATKDLSLDEIQEYRYNVGCNSLVKVSEYYHKNYPYLSHSGYGDNKHRNAEITVEQFRKYVLKKDKEMSKETKIFPLQLDLVGAKKIIAAACITWKTKLRDDWSNLLMEDTIDIHEDDYKDMRDACNDKQHLVLDEVFGKDVFTIEDGIAEMLLNALTCSSSDAKIIAKRITDAYDVKSK